jgi:hypothetical protein
MVNPVKHDNISGGLILPHQADLLRWYLFQETKDNNYFALDPSNMFIGILIEHQPAT